MDLYIIGLSQHVHMHFIIQMEWMARFPQTRYIIAVRPPPAGTPKHATSPSLATAMWFVVIPPPG
jgi:hypothetical protein